MNRIVPISVATAAAIIATGAFADSFIFRRPLQDTANVVTPPPASEEQEAEDDDFDPGPLRIGTVMLGAGPNGVEKSIDMGPMVPWITWKEDTTFIGVLASGGKPPYEISVAGDSASAPRIFYRAENYRPDFFDIPFGGATSCGIEPGDNLCLFSQQSYAMRTTSFDSSAPKYVTGHYDEYVYASIVSPCDVDLSGSRQLPEILTRWSGEITEAGSELNIRGGARYLGSSSYCGGFSSGSVLGAVELDLVPYIETQPGTRSYTVTVRDADNQTASTSMDIRVLSVPVELVVSARSLDVGKNYTSADKLLDLVGGFGDLSVDYVNEKRIPGLDLVDGQLVGTPTVIGSETLTLMITDEIGHSVTVSLDIDVHKDCGDPVVFSTAGTFNYSPPEGCLNIFAEAWGGGGNGITKPEPFLGEGGGGGAYAARTFPADSPTYTIQVAGPEQNSAVIAEGVNIVLARGGQGKSGGSKNGSIGDQTEGGANGEMSSMNGSGGVGGKAGGEMGGSGGAGGTSRNLAGASGQAPGGGGGGGYSGPFGSGSSGTGAIGRVIIQAMP